MTLIMIVNSIIGFFAHIIFSPIFNNYFVVRTSILLSYVVGMILDIFLSWFTLRSYTESHQDRRKGPPIKFDQYIFIRSISALTLGAGVILGYMLDKEELYETSVDT